MDGQAGGVQTRLRAGALDSRLRGNDGSGREGDDIDTTMVDLIKWAGPWAAFIAYALREFKERRTMESIIKRYEQMEEHHAEHADILTKLIERLEPGSSLIEHITYSTQVLTRLCERIESWDRRTPR